MTRHTEQYWHLEQCTYQQRATEDDIESLEADSNLKPWIETYFVLLEVDCVEDGSWDEEHGRNELGSPAAQREELVPLLVISKVPSNYN